MATLLPAASAESVAQISTANLSGCRYASRGQRIVEAFANVSEARTILLKKVLASLVKKVLNRFLLARAID
ncbi:MAG TPA: hypothetical protein VGN05_13125 [Parvibaculum sp.]